MIIPLLPNIIDALIRLHIHKLYERKKRRERTERGEGKEGRRHRAATPVPATAEERRKDGGKREETESAL
ncbi:hypothetical protein SCA6_005875 [Theobroma cacao]